MSAPLSRMSHGGMRVVNKAMILDLIRTRGPLSRSDVAKVTSLAKPTVSVIVEDLIREDLVHEVGEGPTGHKGGRRPILLEFNPQSSFLAGAHIGVRHTTVVLVDAAGREVARADAPTPHADAGAALSQLQDLLHELLKRRRIRRSKLMALGICVPGLVDPEAGVCLLAPNLGWNEPVDLAGRLASAVDVHVFVSNVVQATAVAEHVEGVARGSLSVAMLYEDNGVGAALVSEGRLYHGATGLAGEVGHIKLPGRDDVCGCGGRGCLETMVSAPAIASRAQALSGSTFSATRPDRSVYADVAAAGDPRLDALLRQVGEELGTAASWLINLWNPDVLVLAGGFLEGGDMLLHALRESAVEQSMADVARHLRIEVAELGAEAPLRGAVLLAMQAYDSVVRAAFGTPVTRDAG